MPRKGHLRASGGDSAKYLGIVVSLSVYLNKLGHLLAWYTRHTCFVVVRSLCLPRVFGCVKDARWCHQTGYSSAIRAFLRVSRIDNVWCLSTRIAPTLYALRIHQPREAIEETGMSYLQTEDVVAGLYRQFRQAQAISRVARRTEKSVCGGFLLTNCALVVLVFSCLWRVGYSCLAAFVTEPAILAVLAESFASISERFLVIGPLRTCGKELAQLAFVIPRI